VLPWGVGYESGRGFFYKPEADRVREVFSQFLSGNQSYSQLCALLGVTPRGLHLIMRNPIWMGWRIIDKKRDVTSAGRYSREDGRQADRRKIARAPEDVIRIKVITEPLLSETEFQAVQRLMNLKQQKHWRSQRDVERRFIYNGFLTCAKCGELIHTALARRDYYACKGRRSNHVCTTKYMAREKLEAKLDSLFADQLTDRDFLEMCVRELTQRTSFDRSTVRIKSLTAQLTKLREKRGRVLEAFLDGVITREERDRRLLPIDHEIQSSQTLLTRMVPPPQVNVCSLAKAFGILAEWKFWTREQKRSVLSVLAPDIRVADYDVMALGVSPAVFSNENTRRGRDSSPPRA